MYDQSAKGYAPRALIYLHDLEYLVTGDNNGKVILWDVSEEPEVLSSFREDDSIRCIEYVKYDSSKRFLLIGVLDDFKVYKLKGTELKQFKVV